ncbi:hypothetical protein GCM10027291_41510 [Telluribacter humicola]
MSEQVNSEGQVHNKSSLLPPIVIYTKTRLIKVKVYRGSGGWYVQGNAHVYLVDYTYCIYFLGFLIHSVRIEKIDGDTARKMFQSN